MRRNILKRYYRHLEKLFQRFRIPVRLPMAISVPALFAITWFSFDPAIRIYDWYSQHAVAAYAPPSLLDPTPMVPALKIPASRSATGQTAATSIPSLPPASTTVPAPEAASCPLPNRYAGRIVVGHSAGGERRKRRRLKAKRKSRPKDNTDISSLLGRYPRDPDAPTGGPF